MFCSLQAFSCAKFVGDIFRFNYFLKQLARHKKKSPKNVALALPNFLKPIFRYAHRDLKPDNIMLLDGVAKLVDLGLAKMSERSTLGTSIQGMQCDAC
jgi:serine/threonine protein kinase